MLGGNYLAISRWEAPVVYIAIIDCEGSYGLNKDEEILMCFKKEMRFRRHARGKETPPCYHTHTAQSAQTEALSKRASLLPYEPTVGRMLDAQKANSAPAPFKGFVFERPLEGEQFLGTAGRYHAKGTGACQGSVNNKNS